MLYKNEKAISPIVATLVLIVVAIIGAAAVGVILGAFGSDVGDKSKAGNTSGSQEIIIAGSTTVQPAMESLSKKFMADNDGVKISVSGGGSDAGIKAISIPSIDIGMASKPLTDAQKTTYPTLKEYTIGGSAVVVITNTANRGITGPITKAQLNSIYNLTLSN
jgi:phosphate transport system substrate-binding protein